MRQLGIERAHVVGRGRWFHAHGVRARLPSVFDKALPGEFARGVADADTSFQQELPAIAQWRLAREDAIRIQQPALAIMGEQSPGVSPIWEARHQQLLSWLPNVEGFVLPGATHLLHVQDPRGMAFALMQFFAKHPMSWTH